MVYAVKEIYYSIAGEGVHAGRPVVLCRFTGCNLWSGREEDRSRAICRFCDTDFLDTAGANGGKYKAQELADVAFQTWLEGAGRRSDKPTLVFTGGEPALQLDQACVDAAKARGFVVAVETNGTRRLPEAIDWICVSPKQGAELVIRSGQELKLIYPQEGLDPETFVELEFEHFFIQPMALPADDRAHWAVAAEYCRRHPQWRLSLQLHKVLGVP